MSWVQELNQVTPAAATYKGKAKRVQFTFSALPEQFDYVNTWLVNNFLGELQKQATANNGSQVLKLRLWRDTVPTWTTDYKGELELSTPPGFETPFLVWGLIYGALILVGLWIISKFAIPGIVDIIYGPEDSSGNRPSFSWGTVAIIAVAALILLPQLLGKRS